jgi:LPS O-antigen subunit length determinant protein (WzzB/FepE family)
MNNDKIFIRDLVNIILKYFWKMAIIVVLCLAFSITLTQVMKKKYQADFEINVYSKYFQNPLISGIIPSVYNVPEMRFTIDSMVKEAISDEFIDKIGTEYNIYSDTKDASQMAKEREFLRNRFNYFSTGGQSYKVRFVASDPFIAKEIATKTLDLVKSHFIQTRINTIEMVKGIMVKRLTSFNATDNVNRKGADKALVSKSPDVLNAELSKINNSIAALKKQYKENHPKILTLKEKRYTIKSWLKEFEDEGFNDTVDASLTLNSNKEVSAKISSAFYTKYHDFNIALDIEKRSLETYIGIIKKPNLPTEPIYPKKRLFASVGFLLGLVFAFIYVFFKEIMTPTRSEAISLCAVKFDAVDLGTMPKLTKGFSQKALDQSLDENSLT